jgi:predicted dehydrogenase
MKSRGPQRHALRVAIVGAGLMGYWHGRAAHRLGAEIVGVADPNAERAGTLARALGVRSTAADAADFLQAKCIDAVHICSPLSTHGALARRSIECGIHALVEKPLAESAEETRALFDLARGRGTILCPVHQIAFQDGVADAMHALADLGDPFAIEIRICSAGGVGRGEGDLHEIAGEILPHPLSVLRKLWPNVAWEPERLFVSHTRPGELLISGEYGGALLSILLSMHGRPTCFEMMICGGRGAVQLDFFHGFAVRHDGRVSRMRKILRPFSAAVKQLGIASTNLLNRAIHGEIAYPGLGHLMQAFYAAARGERPSPISAQEAIAVAVARDVILARATSSPDLRDGQIDRMKSAQ